MSERQKLYCFGDLELRCWLYKVENVTPKELASMFHEKIELVKRYAKELFYHVEENVDVDVTIWNGDAYVNIDEKEYCNEDARENK